MTDMTLWTTDLAMNEDGRRVPLDADNLFEWWYFDMILSDGSTCALTFLTKQPFQPSAPAQPFFGIDLSTPLGELMQAQTTPTTYSFASDRCNIVMDTSSVVFDPATQTYSIVASSGQLGVNVTLATAVPGFRNGPFLPPDQMEATWLGEQIIIASGTVTGSLTYPIAGQPMTVNVSGTCYHDHQWGNGAIPAIGGTDGIASWYWGRATIAEYSIVFAQVFKQDDSVGGALFLFARNARMTVDTNVDAVAIRNLFFEKSPMNLGIEVEWKTDQGKVRLLLPAPQTILTEGGYTRFRSPAVLQSSFGGEEFSGIGSAIWEHMQF